jgi:hypothetical protein
VIIIEGPDGSGKTSLIQKLSSKLGYEIAPKAVGSDAQELTDLRRWVDRSLDGGWQPVLYDRHALISEGIYGPAWNGQVREPFQDNYWLCLAMARFTLLRPTIIYCLPPVETVVENIRKDPHNDLLYPVEDERTAKYKVPKSVGQIYWQYHWRACQELTALVYDYTRDDVNSVVNFIQATAQNKGY